MWRVKKNKSTPAFGNLINKVERRPSAEIDIGMVINGRKR